MSSPPKAFGSPIPYAEPLWYSRNTTPYYNDSHRKLRAEVRRYVDEELLHHAFEWEEAGQVPKEAFLRHASLGYLTADNTNPTAKLPANIPASEWDSWHSLIVTDELFRVGYTGVLWGLGGGNGIGVPPIVKFGTTEQKARFLPAVSRGEIWFCLGITEPDAGSDVANIKTTAVRQGDHYVVNGSKKWITNGIFADFVTAAVRTGGPGHSGLSLLIIPLASPGVSRRLMKNSGVNASGSTFIEFDDLRVPATNLLGQEGQGWKMVMDNFNPERMGIAIACVRLSRVCVEDAWKHALTRKTFGKSLVENQTIRAKFAKMGRLIESAWALVEALNFHVEEERLRVLKGDGVGEGEGLRIGGMTALLKTVCTRCLEKCAREAQQVMGGLGYARGGRGGRIEAISRDVRVMAVGGGSEEIMSELAIREEAKDLLKYESRSSRL